ncbi:MAG: ArsR family transcriptional regulator [Candidatus Methanogaster sp.]|uniref:ArsR family transcriptional regulator n=1 Tax=Candidatus Methanogaster sp. TaxID=3386292 RepID=A0AC61KZT6_9EURY|nr:MAG: ArsR family transcriptional regulator [ANME-2 cluster archaeon]
MKDLSVKVLDDDDEEFVDILIKQGLKRNTAKVLAYLKGVDAATSKDLEVGSDLRQPEVSIAMRELRAHDWVVETDEKKPGKGRPYKVYSLNIPIGEIILKLSAKKKMEMEEAMKNIERLKALSA